MAQQIQITITEQDGGIRVDVISTNMIQVSAPTDAADQAFHTMMTALDAAGKLDVVHENVPIGKIQ